MAPTVAHAACFHGHEQKESCRKSDWEELADECYAVARETGLTKERSQGYLKLARKIRNAQRSR